MSLEELQNQVNYWPLIIFGCMLASYLLFVWGIKVVRAVQQWYRRRLGYKTRGRAKEMNKRRELEGFACASLIISLLDAEYQGRFSRRMINDLCAKIASAMDWPDMIPKRMTMQRRDIHALKQAIKKRIPDVDKKLAEQRKKSSPAAQLKATLKKAA